MIALRALDFSLPLSNPVLIFALILFIILFAPILLNKLKIPQLIGLIIAGALIGPNGLNFMLRDSSIELFGTVGLLYIMFLAGLEIDMGDFKKNSGKSLVFGLYTFIIPMTLGTVAGFYFLDYTIATSVLLASMFASHTLISYPIASKLGIAKNKAVNITVGGTVITDTLALLVLAVIVGMSSGEITNEFWLRLSISVVVFGLIVMLLFPVIGRWFFKRYDDNISQYIFVLGMVFLASFLAEAAGIEAIIGAFLAGLALNRLIPLTSPLMNRIEFVGNALFIPFFLIGVGMLIDYEAFFEDFETIKVALIMTFIALLAKFLAAFLTQKTFNFNSTERQLIFGLSSAQAAATLAAVLVGYEVIIGETPDGEPIRLLSESILNGTILMILVTCTVASFATQRAGQKIALQSVTETEDDEESEERILIPVRNLKTTEELINLSITIKSPKNTKGLFALNVINNDLEGSDSESEKKAEKVLNRASVTAAATDNEVQELLRYDVNIVNAITSTIKEKKITDLILGLHQKQDISESFLGNLTEGILSKSNITTLIYKPVQPMATIKRHIVVVPPGAEQVIGFPFWLLKVWNIARNTGATLKFYATEETLKYVKEIQKKYPVEVEFVEFTDWSEFLIISRDINDNDNLLIVLSRKEGHSYNKMMAKIPGYLNKFFKENNFILIYPMQAVGTISKSYNNSALQVPYQANWENFEDLSKTLQSVFKKNKA
ncbi:cation:proton antiporter [Salegentibacter sp.]|uniref:cation:proton antiporter domain-containing protein n=1 Tax=Salegentibacter sp. TaxID=1903072 RepID=UPI0035665D13